MDIIPSIIPNVPAIEGLRFRSIRVLRDVRERGEEAIWIYTYQEYQTRAMDLYRSLGLYVVKEFQRFENQQGSLRTPSNSDSRSPRIEERVQKTEDEDFR